MLRSWKFVCLLIVAAVFAAALPAAAAPALTSISPTSGYPGTQVTYTGTGFGASQGTGSVWLGNKLAGSIVSWSNTQIVAVVAATAASGSAQVQQGGTWSNSIAFTVITPNITSISPTSGYPGTQVTINGTNFGASQGSGSVWLGNKLAGSIVSWSNTQIVAVVAATALSGSCQVQQNGVWGNSVTFTVIQPNITSISPTSGYPGTQVTINGTNFGASQGSGSVWLGNKLAGSIVSWSNTQVVATVAATALSGSAIVQQGGVWSNSIAFTVIQPNITSITPTSGVTGTQVTFTGTNFGASQGSGSVWLGSKLAGSIVSWSNTQVVATVASGSVTGSAIVQQGGVWSNSITFTVATPTLTSISPDTARAGDSITLTGTNFGASQGSGSVWLGSKLAASIVSWSNTQIVATVASGSVTGTAQVQQGGVWTSSIAFNVVTPHVVILTPQSGPPGRHVLFNGTGFGATQGSGRAWVGSKDATILSWGDEYVLVQVAEGSETGTAQLYQNGVWSNSFPFTVEPAVTVSQFYGSNLIVGGFDEGQGAVGLNGPAPAGGFEVAITTSDPSITVPATVTVLEGDYYAYFPIETEEVAVPLEATITATYGDNETFPFDLRVIPPGVRNFSFDSQELTTGQTVTGTVELYKPAPSGGAVVTLVSSNAAFPAPATVTVPEGEIDTTFEVTVSGTVAERTYFSVTANYNNEVTPELSLVLAPPSVVSVSISPSTVVGGEEVTVDLTLSDPAAAGTTVHFQSTLYSFRPPAFAFPVGETTAQFTYNTRYVMESESVTLTAYIEQPGATASVTLEPLAITLASISLSPAELVGSNPATLTVNLTEPADVGGLEVNLYGFGAGVPPFVVVPEGESSVAVPVETSVVDEVTEAYVGAQHGATQLFETLTINPPSGNFATLTLATPRTAGGNLVTATLTLDEPAGAGDAVIALASDTPAVASVPASVTIDEGETTTTFDVDTDAVVAPADVMIRATYNGVIRNERLTVVPTEATISLVSLELDYPSASHENPMDGTVTLSEAAPSGGIVVMLGGSRAGIATVPASVTVPEGETSARFTITTEEVPNAPFILVTATYDGLVRSQLLQVNPNNE
jgi:hypothetical protein